MYVPALEGAVKLQEQDPAETLQVHCWVPEQESLLIYTTLASQLLNPEAVAVTEPEIKTLEGSRANEIFPVQQGDRAINDDLFILNSLHSPQVMVGTKTSSVVELFLILLQHVESEGHFGHSSA